MLEPVGIHRLSAAGGTALLLDSGKCIPRANRPTTVLSTCSQPHANTRGLSQPPSWNGSNLKLRIEGVCAGNVRAVTVLSGSAEWLPSSLRLASVSLE